ncbi:hypothetical protein CONCODRAFT_11152 [Conidiobolus coronatus NRRL 28638]|uniref:Transcription factor domain-containing protein n=1 Tax=Conidiobolus coronatus (strain ATCC 28846 / CBS 209.66 / NRRL 28638) TaxID=796925 RepID=A0A137NVT8_CONC2|nr:hypothetical protein CONCODRAFT_11152 [Conidiobolus coronatus NRRL 28638]|eukprot:KXN66892.1 hypothetical protein CONCODRAFT_11152 [Conidiobolus coronatus NRRL 28638]
MKFSNSFKPYRRTLANDEKNETQVYKYVLFQPILQPVDFVGKSSQEAVTKSQFNNAQKFQNHILLILSSQIINYDRKLIPQIGSFINKIELGVFGKMFKFSIHMDQEWIEELLNPSFEEKCITSYFQIFHPILTCLSKYKFYSDHNTICPVLKSVVSFVGYSCVRKQRPELLKYLKHVAIVQLKRASSILEVGKQSLEYFHQAYLMASTLGIHKDIPGLNEMDKNERRCIRFALYKHDSQLSAVIRIQPHYLFLAPSWIPLNPLYQTNPHSKNPYEFLIAECICLSIKCGNMYWIISANLMSKYSQLTLLSPQAFLDNYTRIIYVLQMLLNHSLIRTLDLHLNLSEKCKNPEELEIVEKFAKTHVRLYHSLIIVLETQLSPESPTLELDQSTKKQLWSAEALYQNSIDVSPLSIPILYRNLCSLSLLYIKLILTHGHIPQHKELLLEKFKQVYNLFNSYRLKYNMPDSLVEFIDIIVNYYKIKI